MATARSAVGGWEVVDLRQLRSSDLALVLEEQAAQWRREFLWNLASSHEALRRFLNSRNLYGHALISNGRPVGYSYFVCEDRKALLGDLYILDGWNDEAAERLLFEHTLRSAALYPGVRRIEGQLLAMGLDPSSVEVFRSRPRVFPRLLMAREGLDELKPAAPEARLGDVVLRPWADYLIEQAADLIAISYHGHVDSEINDQYQSYLGARRFLFNTTRHPGCGEFLRQASVLAEPAAADRLCGACLGTRVDDEIGHITQLCVLPEHRRKGLAQALLRRSLSGFAARGCRGVSLTVTESNSAAVRLYESNHIHVRARFSAFVWEPT
jgi:ribosomal protein S18 acetylase RimI-like enzyme